VPPIVVVELVTGPDVAEGHQVDPVRRRFVHHVGGLVVVETVPGDPHPEETIAIGW